MSRPLPWQQLEQELGAPDLVRRLADQPGGVLSALLAQVLLQHTQKRSPTELLAQADTDPFVQHCDLDQRRFLAIDAALAAALPPDFDAVELAPVAPLGACSVVAVNGQDRVLSALRRAEVVADPTNSLALLAAQRRRAQPETTVRLATSHRVLRCQSNRGKKGFTQHFRLWGFVTAGRDPGGRSFEGQALREHVALHLHLLHVLRGQGLRIPQARVTVMCTPQQEAWVAPIAEELGASLKALEGDYYQGLRVQVALEREDGLMPISDGGLVDWLGKLRADRKEKLMISAIGTELLLRLFG